MSDPTSPSQPELFFTSHNETQPQTIVFLHGLTSSHREWDLVIPHLSSYHLLVPDLPSHSSSRELKPFTLSSAASHIVSLIRAHAHDGKSHVVGLSIGGFVGKELAKKNPELVRTLFITGAAPYRSWRSWITSRPGLIASINSIQNSVPASLTRKVTNWMGLRISDELAADMRENSTSELLVQGFGDSEAKMDAELVVRTLAVAGGKQDSTEATRKQGQVFKRGCAESRACVVESALHAWSVQLPELFAQGVRAWIENTELPKEFKELE